MMGTAPPLSILCRERLPSGFILFAIGPALTHTAHVVTTVVDDLPTPAKQLPLVCGKPTGHDGDHQAAVRWPA